MKSKNMLYEAKEFKNIKIIHHNLPFDKICNPFIEINMHPDACFMSKVAIASKEQGNYWEMNSLLYENKPQNLENKSKRRYGLWKRSRWKRVTK